jgi:hypothetical protein
MIDFVGAHFEVLVVAYFALFAAVLGAVSLWDSLPHKQ